MKILFQEEEEGPGRKWEWGWDWAGRIGLHTTLNSQGWSSGRVMQRGLPEGPLCRHWTGLRFLFCFWLGRGSLLVTGGTRGKPYSPQEITARSPFGFLSFHNAMAVSHFGNMALNKWRETGRNLMFP